MESSFATCICDATMLEIAADRSLAVKATETADEVNAASGGIWVCVRLYSLTKDDSAATKELQPGSVVYAVEILSTTEERRTALFLGLSAHFGMDRGNGSTHWHAASATKGIMSQIARVMTMELWCSARDKLLTNAAETTARIDAL